MRLSLVRNDEPWKIGLQYTDPRLVECQEEYLSYYIQFEDEDDVELSYGITWQNDLKDLPRRLTKLDSVVALMDKVNELPYEKPRPKWTVACWRSVDFGETYDFLSKVVTRQVESVMQEVGTSFCTLFNSTQDLVIAANKDIVEERG